jgi:hypothetical protein
MALRVLAVCTVVIWGVSQVRVPRVTVGTARTRLSVLAHPEGYFLNGYHDVRPQFVGPPVTLKFYDSVGDENSWQHLYLRHYRGPREQNSYHFFDGAFWLIGAKSEFGVGIRYWLILTVLLLLYAAIQFATRAKRLSRLVDL